jgi:hypothetical protein
MQHIIRLQLALMKPGVSDIKIHVDSGGYAIRGHRLHIPVFTHPEVCSVYTKFTTCMQAYKLTTFTVYTRFVRCIQASLRCIQPQICMH